MSVINRSAFLALVKPDLFRVQVDTGKRRPTEFDKVLNVADMPFNPATDRQISGLGQIPTKPEGDQFTLDRPILGGTKEYSATAYGSAVELTYEMWRDDQYAAMKEIVAEQVNSAVNRQEVVGWSVFNNAFDSSYTGFDGLNLCSTAHTLLGGGTIANRPSTDVGLSVTGLQNAIIAFENMTDERGLTRLMSPTRLLIAPANRFVAREILGSPQAPYKADNEINALVQDDLMFMVVHYFTNATQWFLMANQGIHDCNYMWRDRPIYDAYDDPRTKNAVFTVYERMDAGFGSWRGVYGSKAS